MLMRSWLCLNNREVLLREDIKVFDSDVLHFDLEDSIPLAKKSNARGCLEKRLEEASEAVTALRINRLGSEECIRDLHSLMKFSTLPDILIIPKARLPFDAEYIYSLFKGRSKVPKIFAVIETSNSLNLFRKLDSSPEGLSGVIFGSADYVADIGLNIKVANLDYVRHQIITIAKALGLAAIDTPCFSFKDVEALKSEIFEARSLGFDGKIAIHPNQIFEINKGFSVSDKEMKEALTIANSFHEGDSISEFQGKMIGPPFRKQALQSIESWDAYRK